MQRIFPSDRLCSGWMGFPAQKCEVDYRPTSRGASFLVHQEDLPEQQCSSGDSIYSGIFIVLVSQFIPTAGCGISLSLMVINFYFFNHFS